MKSVAKKTARRQRYRLRRFSRIQHDRLLTGLHQIPFSPHVHSRPGVAEIAQETHPIRSKNRFIFSESMMKYWNNWSFQVSVVTRDEVGAYKPYLWEQSTFYNGVLFREWMLTKIVNGERASYSAPKFARMQERTRSQMLEDIVANLQNHAETGQIPKPYRSASLYFIHQHF